MSFNKELMKGSTAMLVLSVISGEDMYGYKIIKEIEMRSENVFALKEGTLYPILHAMEEEGLLASYWVDVECRKRKYYHITHKGKNQLKEKREEFKVDSTAVDRVLNFA
ncbi:MAG: helix-turn-helix transcriptional regulator [Clostridia bacterium]|nr:helix-turn-helix transcriptional regulator [Clostridia bacterium]